MTTTFVLRLPTDCGVNNTETSQTSPGSKDVLEVHGFKSEEFSEKIRRVGGISAEGERVVAQISYGRVLRAIAAGCTHLRVGKAWGSAGDVHLHYPVVGRIRNKKVPIGINGNGENSGPMVRPGVWRTGTFRVKGDGGRNDKDLHVLATCSEYIDFPIWSERLPDLDLSQLRLCSQVGAHRSNFASKCFAAPQKRQLLPCVRFFGSGLLTGRAQDNV